MTVRDRYFSLLRAWTDALISYQLPENGRGALDGAILCPACSVIHGRCHDAVYPLMCMASLTGEEKYLSAAKRLFDWAQYMVCDDGSVYNDSQSEWNGITVFAAIGLARALSHHGDLLTAPEKARWEARLSGMGRWLHEKLTEKTPTNINYIATNSAAMAILGEYFQNSEYAARAKSLSRFAVSYITENGLLAGEGKPMNAVTPRGCRPVDIGYNVEESLPSLYECARITDDEEVMREVKRALRAHLAFMLPDGAWDNSFGTRNFKWTYWGSRTSDGCQAVLNAMGKMEPAFAEAALRNLSLYEKCTKEGLLYGGPHYANHGELPCVHHAFCHAKVLAEALDEGVCEFVRTEIPADTAPALAYYPEMDTYRLRAGDWRMTLTGYDFDYMTGGHASGGAITLLHLARWGAVIATANTDYSLHEAHNQQLSRRKAVHRSLCPRVEMWEGDARRAQMYDDRADIQATETESGVTVKVACALVNARHEASAARAACVLTYRLTPEGLDISGAVSASAAGRARFVLPIISDAGDEAVALPNGLELRRAGRALRITSGGMLPAPERAFNLAPGFEALEICVLPDENGRFEAHINAV